MCIHDAECDALVSLGYRNHRLCRMKSYLGLIAVFGGSPRVSRVARCGWIQVQVPTYSTYCRYLRYTQHPPKNSLVDAFSSLVSGIHDFVLRGYIVES